MGAIRVTNQAQLDAAMARPLRPSDWIECVGDGEFRACGSATVTASGSATVVHEDASMPQKIKARRICAPTYAVDIDGQRIEAVPA